jgi:hypothetical protein
MASAREQERQLRAEAEDRRITAITLPRVSLPDIDEIDAREKARRFLEHRTIREGLDQWRDVNRVNGSYTGWLKIGRALLIGKTRALYVTGANRAWGQTYSREFGRWMTEHGFDNMPGPTRSVAITLAENAEAITTWRNSLPERQRRRLVNPQSVVKRWRAVTQGNGKSPATDPQGKAMAAWARFVLLVETLPPDLAAPLWREAQTRAAERLSRDVGGSVWGSPTLQVVAPDVAPDSF